MTTATLEAPHTQPAPDTVFHRRPRCRRHGVIGYKGGAGKTTCVLCAAETAAKRGQNVLVVDTDAQANASRRLQAFDTERPTIADVLHPKRPVPIMQAVTVCGWGLAEQEETGEHPYPWAQRIHVVQGPSMAHRAAGAEQMEDRAAEAHLTGADNRLAAAMHGVPEGIYDLVLFDTAPRLDHVLNMVLKCLDGEDDGLWLALNPEYDSIEGGIKFIEHVNTHRANLGVPYLTVDGALVINARESNPLHASVLEQLPQFFGPYEVPVYLDQLLPRHDTYQTVSHEGQPVAAFPELHRRRSVGGGQPPRPSFNERMETMSGVMIDG
jgi:cellulose biosynthesis protein BcsQ